MESLEALVDRAFVHGMIQNREEILGLLRYLRSFQGDFALRNCLEIGSESGGTFYLWCQIVRGLKISIDLPNGLSGSWRNTDPIVLAARNRKMRNWAPNVRLLTGDSHDLSIKWHVRKILGGEKLDLLFIDGDHSYEGVKLDYQMYREFVAPGGVIVFHDIVDTEYHRKRDCHVAKFWAELASDSQLQRTYWDRKEFNQHTHCAGIGVLRV